MKIPFEGLSALGLLVAGVGTRLFLVTVALVPTCPMFNPWSHADPAELVSTLLACHVAAFSILSDKETHLHPPFFSIVD